MKVLFIAPQVPNLLYVRSEVQAIWQSGLNVEPYIDEVRHADVLKAVTSGDYDVFWFSGHATKNGLMLTDGPLSASELTPMLRNRFNLVVLNSCDTRQTAQMIQRETEATVIATIVEVPDRLAFQTGALFADALARSGDVLAAYHAAEPGGNRTYVILGNRKVMERETDVQLVMQRLDRMEAAQRTMQANLARVVALIDGDPSYRIIGMPEQLSAYIKSNEEWKEATKQHILSTETRVKALEANNNTIVITRATLLFMVLVGTACLVFAFLVLTWLQSAG